MTRRRRRVGVTKALRLWSVAMLSLPAGEGDGAVVVMLLPLAASLPAGEGDGAVVVMLLPLGAVVGARVGGAGTGAGDVALAPGVEATALTPSCWISKATRPLTAAACCWGVPARFKAMVTRGMSPRFVGAKVRTGAGAAVELVEEEFEEELEEELEPPAVVLTLLLEAGGEVSSGAVSLLLEAGGEEASGTVSLLLEAGGEEASGAVSLLLEAGGEEASGAVSLLLEAGGGEASGAVSLLLEAGGEEASGTVSLLLEAVGEEASGTVSLLLEAGGEVSSGAVMLLLEAGGEEASGAVSLLWAWAMGWSRTRRARSWRQMTRRKGNFILDAERRQEPMQLDAMLCRCVRR